MKERALDALYGCTFLGAAGFLAFRTLADWRNFDATLAQNSYFLPLVLLLLIAGLALLLLLGSFLSHSDRRTAAIRRMALLGALALTAAYIAAMFAVGFILATLLFMPVFAVTLGYRRVVPLVAVTVGVTAGIWYAFIHLLKVFLPAAPNVLILF